MNWLVTVFADRFCGPFLRIKSTRIKVAANQEQSLPKPLTLGIMCKMADDVRQPRFIWEILV